MKLGLVFFVAIVACVVTTPLYAQTSKPPKPKKLKEVVAEPEAPQDLKTVEPADVASAIQRGRALLIGCQESMAGASKPKSEWPYEGVVRVEGNIPIGYRIGGTAICAMALIDTAQEGKLDGDAKVAVDRALTFVLEALEHPLMTTDFVKGYDTRGWGHAYALAFLLKMHGQKTGEKQDKVEAKIEELIGVLEKTQLGGRGGWNYSRSSGDKSAPATFMTAPTLQFLFEAQRLGFAVDAEMVERALVSLEDARLETGAFQYGTNPERQSGKGFEDVPGATGRSPVCETTLFLAGRGSVERVQKSLDAFFEHWRWLEQRRRQTGTHVEPYMIAPYYFFYAHRFAAQAIEFLPEERRAEYRGKLYSLLWHVREKSGGWNDRMFPRSENFGTAMTLFALHEPQATPPASWISVSTEKGSK
ncbi:MAG: hypothetical protein SGI72_15025 [Planctomycetota bacterium]|mgnify:CR=1 FL=1|nr:hypothetical protein [Planctomycetota bacterium]